MMVLDKYKINILFNNLLFKHNIKKNFLKREESFNSKINKKQNDLHQ